MNPSSSNRSPASQNPSSSNGSPASQNPSSSNGSPASQNPSSSNGTPTSQNPSSNGLPVSQISTPCPRCYNHRVVSDLKNHKCKWHDCTCMQCSGETEREKYCRRCHNHSVISDMKDHENCRWSNCTCIKCSMVTRRERDIAYHIARRGQMSEEEYEESEFVRRYGTADPLIALSNHVRMYIARQNALQTNDNRSSRRQTENQQKSKSLPFKARSPSPSPER